MNSRNHSLTDNQREAAEHVDGPLLILAGPGSGKTRVVTHRIAHLLHTGVAARNILALTFTNKAADEMKNRVASLVSGQSVWISTFHRFCSRLLREHAPLVGLSENFTILDMGDADRALRHALEGLGDLNLSQVTPARLLGEISRCKNQLMTAEDYRPHSRSAVAVLLTDVYPAYQRQLRQSNAVDFDDLLLLTVDLLKNNAAVRHDLDERFRYVMVDEYQDTNLAQYAIARALSIDHPNLAVTGDPDQSIYSWRGADIRNILDFEKDYPHVNVIRLEHNFRSTPEILHVADRLIKHNRQRKQKSLIPILPSGEQVKLLAFPSQQDEANYLASDIQSLVEAGTHNYRDFAIFYRVNTLSRYLEHTLHERGIPYQILNGVEFYQRKEVKDVMGYLQLINNSRNDVAFLRIVNTPTRGLGKVTIHKLADYARTQRLALFDAARKAASVPGLSARARTKLAHFVEMMNRLLSLATAPVEEILGHVLSLSGYEEHIREHDERADEDRGANIRELLSAARQFDALHMGTDYLEAFLEQTSLVADTDAWEDESDKVTLMTLHAAKGLEFPVVYLVALEQGKLPHERSREDDDQLEEERRLFFVGITRAKSRAIITYAQYRDYRGQRSPTIPSQFLMELPRAEMDVIMPAETSGYPPDWDEFADDATDFSPDMFEDEVVGIDDPAEDDLAPEASEKRLPSLTTAAALVSGDDVAKSEEPPSRPDPNEFVHGMRVKHPEYGLGKIVAISGAQSSRTATVNFVTAGEKSFVLSRSYLQPLK
jgi:DNA helicase-2/ATP-dependent DNA helicase PcrA